MGVLIALLKYQVETMPWKLFALLVLGVAICDARDPKFIFVSSSTSTSMTTTVSTSSATITCIKFASAKTLTQCGRRKKRATVIDDTIADKSEVVSVMKASRTDDQALPTIDDTKTTDESRQARFAWYYMTTTVTATSTYTSTTVSTASTVSVSISLGCLPSVYVGCGKK